MVCYWKNFNFFFFFAPWSTGTLTNKVKMSWTQVIWTTEQIKNDDPYPRQPRLIGIKVLWFCCFLLVMHRSYVFPLLSPQQLTATVNFCPALLLPNMTFCLLQHSVSGSCCSCSLLSPYQPVSPHRGFFTAESFIRCISGYGAIWYYPMSYQIRWGNSTSLGGTVFQFSLGLK